MFKTSCERCVCAVYDEGSVQKDCALGRIDRYLEKGVPVELVPHDGGQHYQIGTICNACRQPEWFKDVPEDERPGAARRMAAATIGYVIIADENADADDLAYTLQSIAAQDPAPAKVVVVSEPGGMTPEAAVDVVRRELPGVPFTCIQVEPPSPQDLGAYGSCTYSRLIDIGADTLDRAQARFYTPVDAGFPVPADFAGAVDRAVNEDLDNVLAEFVGPTVVFSTFMHQQLGGNRGGSLWSKIESLRESKADAAPQEALA